MMMRSGDHQAEDYVLSLRVIPRANSNEVIGFMDDGRLKIKINSPPVDGRANKTLINYLAKLLGVKKGAITLLTGKSGREKRILVKGLRERIAKAKLMEAISNGKN